MKNINTILISVTTAIVVAILVVSFLTPKLGSAPSGMKATGQIATTTSIGPQEIITIFSPRTSCSSRVIATLGSEINLLFFDPTNGDIASTSLTDIVGYPQAASTTVAYDGGIYGCGRVTAFAEASTTILTSEFR